MKKIKTDNKYLPLVSYDPQKFDKKFSNEDSIENFFGSEEGHEKQQEKLLLVYQNLKYLTDRQKQVISLALDNKNFSEIGKILGINPRTARDIYYKSCKKLAKKIGVNQNGEKD